VHPGVAGRAVRQPQQPRGDTLAVAAQVEIERKVRKRFVTFEFRALSFQALSMWV